MSCLECTKKKHTFLPTRALMNLPEKEIERRLYSWASESKKRCMCHQPVISTEDLANFPIPLRREIFGEPCDGGGFPCIRCWFCISINSQMEAEKREPLGTTLRFHRSLARLLKNKLSGSG